MDWGDLRIFLQVARSGQMTGASRLLGMDQSTISRRIAKLEETMGVVLFERAGRRLTLTEAGAKLLAAAEDLETIIIRDVLSLGENREGARGKIRIGTSEGFGSHYLASRLPKILVQHPELEIELVALQRTFSLGMREVDVVISVDKPESGDIRVKKLTDSSLLIYATKGYFEGRAMPTTVRDLEKDLWCGYIEELLFTDVLKMLTFGDTKIEPRYRMTGVTAQLAAALGGSVLAVLPTFIAGQHPSLQAVLPDTVRIQRPYWLSVHNDLAASPRVRTVIDAVEQLIEGERHLFEP